MDTVLGLIGLVFYIAAIIALAAGVTWLVVYISPNPEKKRKKAEAAASASDSSST